MIFSKPLAYLSPENIKKFCRSVSERGPDDCWPWTDRCGRGGYGQFWVDGEDRNLYAHRVAYYLATGEDPYPLEILHSCDNPPCCNPAHLTKGTHAEDMQDAKDRNRIKHGEDHYYRQHPEEIVRGTENGRHKFTDSEIMDIRQYHADHKHEESRRSMSRKYGITHVHLAAIITGKFWGHLPLISPELINFRSASMSGDNNPSRKNPESIKYGEDCLTAKVNRESVLEIRRLLKQGISQRKIGEKFGITQSAVSKIALRTTWVGVEPE